MAVLLDYQHVEVSFNGDPVVHDVSFQLHPGEILGLVGESGSGKSTLLKAAMGLLGSSGMVTRGDIWFEGKSLPDVPPKEMRRICGEKIGMIFQDPMTSLNPVYTIGNQIVEVILLHTKKTKQEAWARARELLELVGINEPDRRLKQYPHELSGGMRQRVMIAMALACNPKVIIADEPTTALDVTIQAQVLDLIKDLSNEYQTSVIMITHDLGIVAQVCDKVAVMYAGQIIESGTLEDIFTSEEHHPYTKGLFGAIPNLKVDARRLSPIEGLMPDPSNLPSGCHFHDRCPHCMDICREQEPAIYSNGTHCIACHLYDGWDGKKEETT